MPAYQMSVNVRQEPNDCARVALASYLGESYEDVLRAATKVDKQGAGKKGHSTRQIIRIAAELGHTLKHRFPVNFHSDYGILLLRDHAVVLRNGLIFDVDGTVTDACDWLVLKKYKRCDGLLVEDGGK